MIPLIKKITCLNVNGEKEERNTAWVEYKQKPYDDPICIISTGLINRCKFCKEICLIAIINKCCVCGERKKRCMLCSLRRQYGI